MKILAFPFFFILLWGCKAHKIDHDARIQLHYLDDYVIPAEATFKTTNIGGLSGIDYTGDEYILISDQKSNPRLYFVQIRVQDKKIDTVLFKKMVELDNENTPFFKNNYLDLEAIRYQPNSGNIVIASEGSVSRKKDPSVFTISPEGKFIVSYSIPPYFEATSPSEPSNNGLFESLSNSVNQRGVWVGTELPLHADGPKPMLVPTTSPVRVTYYDNISKKPTKQFTYLLEPIAKIPLLPFHINGLSDILAISPNKFLMIERGFSAGLGSHGMTIRIYLADISNATNTLNIHSLKKKMKQIVPAEKKLLFDFDTVEKKLSQGIIDNIEGITFGPRLPNGNKTLLLISDNNFNALGPQLNQVILMEMEIN